MNNIKEVEKSNTNLQHNPKAISNAEISSETPHTSNTEPSTKKQLTNETVGSVDKSQWRYAPFDCVTDELVAAQSCPMRVPTRYVREIQTGIGTVDGRKAKLPTRMQINKLTTEDEEEAGDNTQIEHAMAAAVFEIEAIDPLSLEEAR